MWHSDQGMVSIAQARMAGLPPEQRQYFMQQQQLVIAQMQQQVGSCRMFCCNNACSAESIH
jgi:hypothetical protein